MLVEMPCLIDFFCFNYVKSMLCVLFLLDFLVFYFILFIVEGVFMKKVVLFFIAFFTFCIIDVSAAEYNVSTEEELIMALNNQSEEVVINLNSDISVNNLISITGKILINGNGHTISLSDGYSGVMFNVSGTLDLSNVKFDGNNDWYWVSEEARLNPDVSGDELTLVVSDKKITNNLIEVVGTLKINNSYIYNYYIDGTINDTNTFIKVNGADSKVVIESTTLDNLYGSFVFVIGGKVEFNNSKIINCYGLGNKGSLFKQNGGELFIDNSVLKDNCGRARSGSLIGAVNGALVTFNSGLIDNNIAKYHGTNSTGSMITIESGAGFVMNGGTISNNVGTLSSVISSRWTNDPNDKGIYLNGGVIKNNTTTKTSWVGASVFLRSACVVGENMTIVGDVVVNNTNASLENNGTINGKVTLNDSTATAVNNGSIADLDLLNGEFTNNKSIINVYELDTQVINNGVVTGSYVKELSEVEGKIIVKFDLNDGKDVDTGYTSIDKLYDLNYMLLDDDIPEAERDGYTFEGWFTDSKFTKELDLDSELTENTIIYAKWVKIPEVEVPDTQLNISTIMIMISVIFMFIGSIVMYMAVSNKKIEE